MSADEMTELHEHAEHAAHDPSLAPVSLSMAVIAVLVATVSLMGHRSHTEEILLQSKATDQWAYYQAKNIRRNTDEIFADLSTVVAAKDAAAMAKFQGKYSAEASRQRDEQKKLEEEARKLEEEGQQERRRADRFDLAEVFLEIALVVTSITLLSKKRGFWYAGLVLSVVGVVAAVSGWVL